jgi:uncharacterized protein
MPEEYEPLYLAGIDHFNRGDYFEAHEVWEDLWHDCPAADRLFYQSLIQAAVALYHSANGNRVGAERLFARGRAKMAGYAPAHHGLDGVRFWLDVERALAGGPAPRIALDPPPHHGSEHER